MLVTAKEMLLEAKQGKYAIGAFNVENMEMVMAVLAAAEAKNSPVIMQTTPGTIKYAGGIITVAAPSQIAVYSIDGKCVATANGESVDTDDLSQGAYVVKAVDANGNVQTMKFVK